MTALLNNAVSYIEILLNDYICILIPNNMVGHSHRLHGGELLLFSSALERKYLLETHGLLKERRERLSVFSEEGFQFKGIRQFVAL